ncbi:MAG: hypothetical protein J0M04_02665 [Verrucomicrobia bacterium]|nr:hypothetical protein [Verrucomicrobiota bacterium]
MKIPTALFAPLLALASLPTLSASTPLPSWYGEPGTTRQGFRFSTSSQPPVPEISENPYGTATSQVVLGAFAAGYQSPDDEFATNGVLKDGAWDLGVAGSFSMACKIAASAPAPGETYRVDFLIYAVYYLDAPMIQPPWLDTLGLTAQDLAVSTETVGDDGFRPYVGKTWTGYFSGVSGDGISVAVRVPTVTSGTKPTSVLDTFEVFTRVAVVPEPAVPLLAGLTAVFWIVCRKRS